MVFISHNVGKEWILYGCVVTFGTTLSARRLTCSPLEQPSAHWMDAWSAPLTRNQHSGVI